MRVIPWMLALVLVLVPSLAGAVPRRAVRDRFAGTWSLGVSLGAGSPRGLAGGFVELRPVRALGLSAGGGFGGAFGPAVDVQALLSPFGGRGWALDVGVSLAHQFSLVRGAVVPGRAPLPASTNWVGVEAALELRPARGWMVRVGVGRAWLLDTAAFRIARESELANVSFEAVPGTTPLDAVRAAARDETLGVWFVHLDFAPAWRF